MYGLFEHLAAEGLEERDAQRKAIIVAKKRADDRFGNFFRQASNKDEFDARLSMVSDDFADLVTAASNEYGVDSEPVSEAVISSFIPEEHIAKVASMQHEARKPKMCPYHKEVTDISLAAGQAQAGFNAMAQHAWGSNHCQGEWDGKCNFKPEMTTQAYWDDKAERAEQRRQEREEAQAQQPEFEHVEEMTDFDDRVDEPVEDVAEVETDLPDNVIEVDFGGNDTSDQEVPMAVAASFQVDADTHTSEYKYVKKQGDKWVITQKGTGKVLSTHDSEEKAKAAFRAMEMNMHGGKVSEALKSIDVDSGGETPSPKMDKRKWTPETVKKLDNVDSEDGPHPTKTKDITEPIVAENASERTEIGEGVTERQDVSKDTNPSDQGKGGTFPKGNQASPVTSSWTPQILESVS